MTTTLLTVLPDGTTYEPAKPEPEPHPEIVSPADLRHRHTSRSIDVWADGTIVRKLTVTYDTAHGWITDDLLTGKTYVDTNRAAGGCARQASVIEQAMIRALSLGHVARLAIVESGGAA